MMIHDSCTKNEDLGLSSTEIVPQLSPTKTFFVVIDLLTFFLYGNKQSLTTLKSKWRQPRRSIRTVVPKRVSALLRPVNAPKVPPLISTETTKDDMA